MKQDLDYSCGAASIATLLQEYYGVVVTEQAVLAEIDKGDGRASFGDMARVLPKFGFRAEGFAAAWKQLTRLKMPVIVYLKHRKDDHFSVLRGIDDSTVWLADPSLGNRTYSREQFMGMWHTRSNEADGELPGKLLAILPTDGNLRALEDFFTKVPVRQTGNALTQLTVRLLP